MADVISPTQWEALRQAAAPEVKTFVDWAAGELTDRFTREFRNLGFPPMAARREAEGMARIVIRRVLGAAQAFHAYGK